MELKFKIQQYQTDAVENVINVFNGQPNQSAATYKIDQGKVYEEQDGEQVEVRSMELEDTGYKNGDIKLSEQQLLDNIHHIQTENNIHLSRGVVKRLGRCQLDVEMETGTGKTYVYIKTMFEMNRRYGWTKFIVVVPSIAIREGVKKSFDITRDHFMELYGKKARYFVYSGDNLNQIDSYSQSADISVMIINTQAFNTSLKEGSSNKTARIIYDRRDEFRSRRPIDVIAANRPIIILDEPQKMGGAATQTALALFKPLFTLNYSATHKEAHNPVYVLDALDAYNRKLVKKIEVVGFELKNLGGTDCYIYLSDIILTKDKAPQARIEFEVQSRSGSISRKTRNLSEGDSLYALSGEMNQYEGFVLTEICVDPANSSRSCVVFGNGQKMHIKEVTGNVSADHKARIQIRETIKAHFRKESTLFHKGIKCLSLFFIDEVARYRQYDADGNQTLGRYGEIFEQEYNAVMEESNFDPEYKAYLDGISAHDTHAGYFSIDKKGHAVDSQTKRGSDTSDDTSAYDLILKNKERLLSFDEPVRFIFSHSALREGWDNPNVFQICSLRQSGSTSQKRQEVGRGLRLCVDRDGIRQDAETIGDEVQQLNRLTVIASEGYATFTADLQRDIRADLYDRPTRADVNYFTGKTFLQPDGTKHTFTANESALIYSSLVSNGYINQNGEVQQKFHEDLANGALKPMIVETLQPFAEQVYKQVQGIFDPSVLNDMVENGSKVEVPANKLNANFHKKEFQELWKRINHKYTYLVSFDSDELIRKAVPALDREIHVSRLSYSIKRGAQRDNLTHDDMTNGDMMTANEAQTEYLKTDIVSNVRYDLLGKISMATKLTRKTVAAILSGISALTFNQYKANPEEFIQQAIRIIMEQKATMIVDHIKYNQVDGQYDSSIFTQEKHTSMDKAYEGKKSIVDWVFTDGTAEKSTERKFVEQLDISTEVVVYAKLPKGFHIPTPVGNYSPDWAIAFEQGKVKHVYFIAETKGSMSSLQLRDIEKSKIECADKLFKQLSSSDIKYGKVDSFDTLLKLVR